jgi:PKD repeat protein
MKKVPAALVAAIISISVVVPFVTQAQTTTSSEASLIAVVTQFVHLLEQELQQLIAAQGGPTTPTTQPTGSPTQQQPAFTATFTAAPTSGGAPLAVTFYTNAFGRLNFGDGTSGQTANCWIGGAIGDTLSCNTTHTYSAAGTYMATLRNSSGATMATAKVAVTQ